MGASQKGAPIFYYNIMSSAKPTDTDHEVLKLLRWIRENFTIERPRIVGETEQPRRWISQGSAGWSYCSEEFILDHYKVTQKEKDAKHKTHNKLS